MLNIDIIILIVKSYKLSGVFLTHKSIDINLRFT